MKRAFLLISAFFLVVCTHFLSDTAIAAAPDVFTVTGSVLNPQTNIFVDTLNTKDPKFIPDQHVQFKIVVSNNDTKTFPNVIIKNIFPPFVNYKSGAGIYDTHTRTLMTVVGDLRPGESKNYILEGQVMSAVNFTKTGLFCVTNTTSATNRYTMVSIDYTQLCLEKAVEENKPAQEVAGASTQGNANPIVYPPQTINQTPATGGNILTLFGLISGAGAGIFLRKFSNRAFV